MRRFTGQSRAEVVKGAMTSILPSGPSCYTPIMPTSLYIDADACPVKDEAVRVAERHGLTIHFVSNAFMRLPEGPLIKRVVVSDGPDAADDWIAERITKSDIAVTADIPLAARCLEAGARVV